MPAPYLYYLFPFAISADDLASIPNTPPVDGSVNYQTGWTDPYELNLLTNPSALPIPRGQMNQLFYDITNNLQQYQQYGTPLWVVGNTVSYPIYARVYYAGVLYESQTAANTNTPGTDATWVVISGNTQGVETGTVIDFAGLTAPVGYQKCDGSALLRTTYANLLTVLTQSQTVTTSNGSAIVTGLTNCQTTMYVGMHIESANFAGGTTILTVDSATQVTMSTTATAGTSTAIKFFNWGNGDGSTTFNVPDLRYKGVMGSGGTAGTTTQAPGNVLGQTGGEAQHTQSANELVAHSHPPGSGNGFRNSIGGGGSLDGTGGTINTVSATTGTNSTTGSAFNVIGPTAIVTKCIKL